MGVSRSFRLLLCSCLIVAGSDGANCQSTGNVDRAQLANEINQLGLKLSNEPNSSALLQSALERERLYLAPSPDDMRIHSRLLADPAYGIFRLLPREVFDTNSRMISRGGGAYYSFSTLEHEYTSATDIEFGNGTLVAGLNGTSLGAFVLVPDLSIEAIDGHPAIEALASFAPSTSVEGARDQYRSLQRGLTLGSFSAVGRAPVTLGTVYLLRSILYEESDTIVALTPTRIDSDGSLIIVWRLIKRLEPPTEPQEVQGARRL